MYVPEIFEVSDKKEIFSFIQANAFGQLISTVEQRLTSTNLPFLLDEKSKTLTCHLARNNPQWQNIDEQEVLVSFLGAHDYISPSWYSTPGVPTWNYQAAHVYGKCKLVDDRNVVKQVVEALTAKYEALQNSPWKPDYQAGMLNAIVGLEISISEIQCKYKLSQNKIEQDQKQVIHELTKRGSTKLSTAMRSALASSD